MADNDAEERLLRFHLLYGRVLQDKFDRAEFEADDLYAFQAFERALRSSNQELRNLAAHLQAQRQDAIESITLSPMEILARTKRMAILTAEQAAAPPEGEAAPALKPQLSNHRSAATLPMSEEAVYLIGELQPLYLAEFGRTLDLDKFREDEEYGFAVLKESLRAGNPAVVDAAKRYLAERRSHRADGKVAQEAPKAAAAP